MGHVLITKTSNGVGYGIHISNMIQKLISQAFPSTRPFYQPSNIEELERGGNHLFRMDQFCNSFQSLIRDRDDTYIRLDRTEAVTCHLCSRRREGIKDRRLPNIRKADDPAAKTHSSHL